MAFLLRIAILGVLLTFTAMIGRTFRILQTSAIDVPLLSKAPIHWLSPLTLGHRFLYDDYVYLWLLQKLILPAGVKFEKTSEPLVRLQINEALRVSPQIKNAYFLSCFAMAFDFSNPQVCQNILSKAEVLFPQDWLIPMTRGYFYAFQLNDQERAGYYYLRASEKPGAPAYAKSLGEKLRHSPEDFLHLFDGPEEGFFKNYLENKL